MAATSNPAAQSLSDGTVNWVGGMDTSRSAADVGESQYSKACNVIIPSSLGGIKARFGFHCAKLEFDCDETKEIYRSGRVQGEGFFKNNGRTYLVCVVSGYVLKFTRTASNRFYVHNTNSQDRNVNIISSAWVTTIPNGCIVNNGFDYPLYVTESTTRRTNPKKGEIGIGQMGVYLQNRLFFVDQSGKRILASDFMQPLKFTREDTNIFGFICPDSDEVITAIGKQKSMIGTVEGGNLIWSSNKDIYSTDVRGTRSDWSNLSTKVGKTSETIPGFSAASSYSFESFNTNIYFRTKQFGMADLRQSEYQFVNLDSMNGAGIEASYYYDNDTDWMLNRCYSRSCNKRLYTTVAPEMTEDGYVYWNGIIVMAPSALYEGQGVIPRRHESVFTGIRPWCLTVVTSHNSKDEMFIHSYDKDGINRLYVMNEDSDYDIDKDGNLVEIKGFIETRAYGFKAPLILKHADKRFYRLNVLSRTTKIKLFSRPEVQGRWTAMWDTTHLVGRTRVVNGAFLPESTKGQTRDRVNVSDEKFSPCYRSGNKFLAIQYRIEFEGPINLDSFIVTSNPSDADKTIYKHETETITLVYEYRPDYDYSITLTQDDLSESTSTSC